MQRLLSLACVAAAAAISPAHAAVIDASFSGTVQSQTGTAFASNAAISGSFAYDTTTNSYLSFTVGGFSVATEHGSSAAITPDQYSALYEAQHSPVPFGGLNSSFSLDLEGVNPWSTFDAVALLGRSAELAGNLDTGLSSFGFYVANADGTGVQSVTANLASFQVSAVPEPTSAVLMLIGLLGVGAAGAARGKRRLV